MNELVLILTMIFSSVTDAKQLSAGNLDLQQQVTNTEIAFAKTMADRDFEAFKTFLSSEAVFLSGKKPVRDANAIAELWQKYYKDPAAPFSWRPETVQVLDSGKLALSTGPVFNTKGKLFSYYTSTWWLEEDGKWRIIFDKGNKACPSSQKKTTQ